MERLNNDLLIYSDQNYTYAVNYRYLYNFPITLNYGEKHARTKYILSAGTRDIIEIFKEGIYIYVLTQHSGLSYMGLDIINTETKELTDSIHLNESDCCNIESITYGILDMDSEEQVSMMLEYV